MTDYQLGICAVCGGLLGSGCGGYAGLQLSGVWRLLCRAERLKLEKDYLELQSKAFAAPEGALAEVGIYL